MAIVGGKTIPFTRSLAWTSEPDFGTDGGAHNFLRYIESWNGQTLNYRGSIVSFFNSRQAIGIYKYTSASTAVYQAPTRGYNFDTDFLPPATLAAWHADVPRRQHADVQAAAEADAIASSCQLPASAKTFQNSFVRLGSESS